MRASVSNFVVIFRRICKAICLRVRVSVHGGGASFFSRSTNRSFVSSMVSTTEINLDVIRGTGVTASTFVVSLRRTRSRRKRTALLQPACWSSVLFAIIPNWRCRNHRMNISGGRCQQAESALLCCVPVALHAKDNLVVVLFSVAKCRRLRNIRKTPRQ